MGSLIGKKPKKASFDIAAADYRQAVQDRTDSQRNASNELLKQLEDQRKADAPSLAAAQLKSAAAKNLSQLLAASAARRGSSPTSQIASLGVGMQGGKDLMQSAGQAGLAEQSGREALAAKLGIGQQQQDLAQVMEPGRILANAEKQRFEADAERNRQAAAARSQMTAALIGAGGQLLSGFGGASAGTPESTFRPGNPQAMMSSDMMSDEDAKKNVKSAKKPVNDFLDALLESRQEKPKEEVPELSDAEIMRQARKAAVMKLMGKGK